MTMRAKRWMTGLVALILVWLALVLSEWLPRPSAADQAALTALAPEPASAKGARNGFAALWLMGYEVPQAELDAVLAADLEAYNARLAQGGNLSGFESTAKGKYAAVASPTNDPALCETWKDDCLARVRAAPEATRKRLADFAVRLVRLRMLGDYDHFHYEFAPRFDSPLGSMSGFSLELSEAALQYVDGNPSQAFATLCSDTATWRRLRSHSDMIINDMVGVAQMSAATQLYAQMLSEQPLDFSAPCPDTFAPLADAELDQCAEMRFEYLSAKNSMGFLEGMVGPSDRFMTKVVGRLMNAEHVVRDFARQTAPYCQDEHRARVAARDPTPLAANRECGVVDHVFDPVGCAFMQEWGTSYHLYYTRVLDLDARLRLLGVALSLRGVPPAELESRFAARPRELDSPSHQFALDAAAGSLRLHNLDNGHGEVWELPLLVQAAPAAPQP